MRNMLRGFPSLRRAGSKPPVSDDVWASQFVHAVVILAHETWLVMKIPFVDLEAQYHRIEPHILAAIEQVLRHKRFIMGPEVAELEERLAESAGVRYAVACSSGTDALLMALMARSIGPGDAVFTTPFTFIATAEVISLLGATPVFVDIHPRTFNLDPEQLRNTLYRIERETNLTPKAVIPVDLFGLPADYDAIKEVVKQRNMLVLEDAAQSFGGTYKGRQAGSLGDVAATSFFPAKPLGCYGDGGALLTDDEELASTLKSIRVHGTGNDKYDNIRIGLNGRLDTLQAAVVLAKLPIFQEEIEQRQQVAQRYTTRLQTVVETPLIPDGYISAWAQYSILTDHRNAIQGRLKEASIPCAIYYSKPLHLQGAFSYLGYCPGDFPHSEAAAARILSLPMHPYLSPEQIDFIGDHVAEAI